MECTEREKAHLPPQHFDLVLEGILLALERLFVDDLDGVGLARSVLALREPDLRERAAAIKRIMHYTCEKLIKFRRFT